MGDETGEETVEAVVWGGRPSLASAWPVKSTGSLCYAAYGQSPMTGTVKAD